MQSLSRFGEMRIEGKERHLDEVVSTMHYLLNLLCKTKNKQNNSLNSYTVKETVVLDPHVMTYVSMTHGLTCRWDRTYSVVLYT